MRRDRNPHLPPASRVPYNLAGIGILEIEEYEVASWCPLPDGKGPATEVHVMITLRGIEARLVLRFKSARAVDELVGILERHRNDVWPTPGDPTMPG